MVMAVELTDQVLQSNQVARNFNTKIDIGTELKCELELQKQHKGNCCENYRI